MSVSQKFKFIGKNLNKMLYMITTNQNFLRYLYWLNDNPLDPSIPDVEEKDVEEQIHPYLFDETVTLSKKIEVFFHPLEGTLDEPSLGYDIYILDIIIPNDYWILKGQGEFRDKLMAYEIATRIDGQNIAGIGQVKIFRYKNYKIKSSYHGITLWIKTGNLTIKT